MTRALFNRWMHGCLATVGVWTAWLMGTYAVQAQSVGLPSPRLQTTWPMGGQIGTTLDVTITGENIDDAELLAFSHPRITAKQKRTLDGEPLADQYTVTIANDCPPGLYEARLMTRLGVSSSRVFSVSTLPEVVRKEPNTTLATALELPVNSVCNGVMTQRAVDHYTFQARRGQRVVVECAAKGIDSKLDPVLIVADAEGRDLQVERLAGLLDFTAPSDGRYVIKVHEMTYKGGPQYFYRLIVQELAPGATVVRAPATRAVNTCSWPPVGLPDRADATEREPNDDVARAQKITLPCDIAGSFFPAADNDVFEFQAKKGDEWWVEVASERLGRPTDPSMVVQLVTRNGDQEMVTDVAEFSDIPSPVKTSSNGYAYDGPPYNAGSSDILAKLVIAQDGVYRLQLTDLFGGTRSDPRNEYRLVIRKAQPDFAVVAWALHMELRNGDRNALTKPLALRGGATVALEVVAIRRDGFDGPIELAMSDLPPGVTAQGLTIPAGKSRGIMLVTASEAAPRGLQSVKFVGRAKLNDQTVERSCAMASMAWSVPDAWGEIPYPRLLADVPVAVSGRELATITLAPQTKEPFEVRANGKLTIPMKLVRRSEFSGTALKVRVFGHGFEAAPTVDIPFNAETTPVVLDLAALKTPPGEYVISFYGSAVAKYRYYPEAVTLADAAFRQAETQVKSLEVEVKKLSESMKATPTDAKQGAEKMLVSMQAKQKAAADKMTAASTRRTQATEAAKPKDIVDIVVSEPISIRVLPAEKP